MVAPIVPDSRWFVHAGLGQARTPNKPDASLLRRAARRGPRLRPAKQGEKTPVYTRAFARRGALSPAPPWNRCRSQCTSVLEKARVTRSSKQYSSAVATVSKMTCINSEENAGESELTAQKYRPARQRNAESRF